MAMWKLLFCVTFLVTVASHGVPANSISLDFSKSDFLKIFPQEKEKMAELVSRMSNATKSEQVAILNDYTDDCIVNMNQFIISQSMDPLPMPDLEEKFQWQGLLITYHGLMSLKAGWLTGIGSIVRMGDVTLKYDYPNVKIHSPLGFESLMFNYKYSAKFMNIGPSGGVDGRVDGLKYTFEMNLNMITLQADIERFSVDTLGKVDVKLNGNILIDWIINLFVNVTLGMIKPILKVVVEGFVTSLLDMIIVTYNNAMFCLLTGICP